MSKSNIINLTKNNLPDRDSKQNTNRKGINKNQIEDLD